jgi:hypothetical protein
VKDVTEALGLVQIRGLIERLFLSFTIGGTDL